MGQCAVRTARWRLLFEGLELTDPGYLERLATAPIDGGRFRLFDSRADPGERRDVLAAHRDVAESLRGEMVRWRVGLAAGTAEQELTPELRRMLQDRGYW